jgi:hypothetical protein
MPEEGNYSGPTSSMTANGLEHSRVLVGCVSQRHRERQANSPFRDSANAERRIIPLLPAVTGSAKQQSNWPLAKLHTFVLCERDECA